MNAADDRYSPYQSPFGYLEWDFERYRTEDPPEPNYDEPKPYTDIRPPFARDHDRLLYTTAYRRLQGKTQVVTPGQADFFHTRLTHTVEVSQVARRLTERLNFRANWGVANDTAAGKRSSPGRVSSASSTPTSAKPPRCYTTSATLHSGTQAKRPSNTP